MLDLENLCEKIQNGSEEIEVLDPRFSNISSYMEKSQYIEAKQELSQLLSEGFFDIRLLNYYLFLTFEESQTLNLHDIFNFLTQMLQDLWVKIPPFEKKDTHAVRSIQWIFTKISKILQFHEQKKDSRWNSWIKNLEEDSLDKILATINTFKTAFQERLEAPTILDKLQRITQWVEELRITLPSKNESKENDLIEEIPSPSNNIEEKPSIHSEIPSSQLFEELLKKLNAFEGLIQKEDFPKAALVSNDLSEIITNFDPRLYFPKLFSEYFKLLSIHIESLANYWEEKESLSWQSLEQLYKVDLDTFMEV